ncbi:ATP-binding protein [Kitasatospora purpeofusca]|uniref:ATP-binding protein n=1 Tax=Kitasatospora purpeofusca TaxID=67352 RepID=UPI0035D65EE2
MPSVSTTFPATRSSVGAARRATADTLAGLGPVFDEERVEIAKLLVSELVTNAVLYGSPRPGGELRIVWSTVGDDMLKVAVSDGSSAVPCLRAAGADDEHGRGLEIVRRLAAGSGWDPEPDGGKSVWFTLVGTAPGPRSVDAFSPAAPAAGVAVLCAHGLEGDLWTVPRDLGATAPHARAGRPSPSSAA